MSNGIIEKVNILDWSNDTTVELNINIRRCFLDFELYTDHLGILLKMQSLSPGLSVEPKILYF